MANANRSVLRPVLCLLVPVLLALTGCMDITGRGPAPLTKTLELKTKTYPRVGHVYCMRGWLGIFSTGMDELARRIDQDAGVPAVSVADEEWHDLYKFIIEQKKKGNLREPLVLLGHSYGADDQIRVAERLKEEKIEVDLLVLLDPVTPPDVPSNVKRVFCMYFSHPLTDWYPAWRGVPATVADKATPLVNIDLRTTDVGFDTSTIHHVNVEKVEGVHKLAIEEIKKVCYPRSQRVAHTPAPMFNPSKAATQAPATRQSSSPATQTGMTVRSMPVPVPPAVAATPAPAPAKTPERVVAPVRESSSAMPRVGPREPGAAAVRPE